MTEYETSSQVSGAVSLALTSAISVLANNGFKILSREPEMSVLEGPGMNSTKQNALVGASKITLRAAGDCLRVEAELGSADRMRRFLMTFPFFLGMGLGLLFGISSGVVLGQAFGIGFGVPWAPGWQWLLFAMGISFLPVAPWLVLSPLIARSIAKRTRNALDLLVINASQMSD